MGKECSMQESLNLPLAKDEEGEIKLNLELSIGGSYGKTGDSTKMVGKKGENFQESDFGLSRSDFSCDKNDGFVDLQKRKEIQALRRQEGRKKREEKMKKSRGGVNGNGFLEDNLFLESQQFRTRVCDRENREKEMDSSNLGRKIEKNGADEVGKELNLSLGTENREIETKCSVSQPGYLQTGNWFGKIGYGVPSWGHNVGGGMMNKGINVFRPEAFSGCRNGNLSIYCDSVVSNEKNDHENLGEMSNVVSERSSSALSHNQKEGSNIDTGSRSSSSRENQHTREGQDALERREGNASSCPTEPEVSGSQNCSTLLASSTNSQKSSKWTENFKVNANPNKTSTTSSASENRTSTPSKEMRSSVTQRPPKPPKQSQVASSIPHMPCVSATGTGPNGKTVNGFLYKYTKSEVSIMCVCHGISLSPAEFVQHAGCVDVTHPLRHITVVPSVSAHRVL